MGRVITRRASVVVGGLAVALLAVLPLRAEPSAAILPLPFAAAQMRGPESEVATALATSPLLREAGRVPATGLVAVWGEGGAAALALIEGAVRARSLEVGAVAEVAQGEIPRGALPGSRRAVSGGLTAFLTQPTTRYLHDALGPGPHAGALTIRERKPVPRSTEPQPVPVDVATVEAGADAVFEDRAPRFATLEGRPTLLVVRSTFTAGAALALVGRGPEGGPWRVLAETPPEGAPQRWLNPAAVADFAGTGRPQIALVRTPHRDGRLQLWAYESGHLALKAEGGGYADHAFGASAQDLAAVLETEGGPLLVIPTLERTALAFVSFRGGMRERGRVALPAPARFGVAVLGRGAEAHVLVGLEDGRIADVRPGALSP